MNENVEKIFSKNELILIGYHLSKIAQKTKDQKEKEELTEIAYKCATYLMCDLMDYIIKELDNE